MSGASFPLSSRPPPPAVCKPGARRGHGGKARRRGERAVGVGRCLSTWRSPRRRAGPQSLGTSLPLPTPPPQNCRWGLGLSIRTRPRGRPHPPRSLFLHRVPALQRPVSGPLRPHLHGDSPALHGGEAVGQRQARRAGPVPGALHRVGLGKVGAHGGGGPAASGAGERSATRAAPEPGAPRGARGRSGRRRSDARCR